MDDGMLLRATVMLALAVAWLRPTPAKVRRWVEMWGEAVEAEREWRAAERTEDE